MTNLTKRSWPRRIAAVAGAACMAVSFLSVAQPGGSLPQVTVHGDRTLTIERIGTSRSFQAPIERFTMTRPVSYADLDLGTHEGRAALNKRVRAAAIAACGELDLLAPLQTSEVAGAENVNQNCEKDAINGTMPQVDAAVTAARTASEPARS